MKLGKELAVRLYESGAENRKLFVDVVASLREDAVNRMIQAKPEDLAKIQRAIQGYDELIKTITSVDKELEIYRTR